MQAHMLFWLIAVPVPQNFRVKRQSGAAECHRARASCFVEARVWSLDDAEDAAVSDLNGPCADAMLWMRHQWATKPNDVCDVANHQILALVDCTRGGDLNNVMTQRNHEETIALAIQDLSAGQRWAIEWRLLQSLPCTIARRCKNCRGMSIALTTHYRLE